MNTTRRTALKLIAAALTAPVVQIRKAIPDERLMLPFCDKDSMWRYAEAMKQPFGVGSLTYATDARSMIRAELANRHEVGEIRLPPVERSWADHWHPSGQWRPLSFDDIKPTIDRGFGMCPECGDRQISLGEEYPDFSDPVIDATIHKFRYNIDDNSIGDKSCKTCGGMEYFGPALTDVLGSIHQSFNLRRIAALPNAMVCRTSFISQGLLFRADGFEGISLGVEL